MDKLQKIKELDWFEHLSNEDAKSLWRLRKYELIELILELNKTMVQSTSQWDGG